MASIKYRDGQNFPAVLVKVGDTLPVGTELDYDGDTVPLGYEQVADGDLIVSSTEPSGNDRRKVWLRHGNNLFNSSGFNWATGTTLEYTSIYVGVGTYTIFSPNMPVGINNVANFFILANKVTTGADTATNGVDKNNVRTVTSTDGYLTIANRASTGNNPYAPKDYKFMINSGSTALDYEDYVYDKTYILNDNNVYEEYAPQNDTLIIYNQNSLNLKKNGNIINFYTSKYISQGILENYTIPEQYKPKTSILTNCRIYSGSTWTGRQIATSNASFDNFRVETDNGMADTSYTYVAFNLTWFI